MRAANFTKSGHTYPGAVTVPSLIVLEWPCLMCITLRFVKAHESKFIECFNQIIMPQILSGNGLRDLQRGQNKGA